MSEEQSKDKESVEITNEYISVNYNESSSKGSNSRDCSQDQVEEDVEPEFIVDLDGGSKDDPQLPYSCPSPVTNLMLMSASEESIAPCVNVRRYEGSDHHEKHVQLYKLYPMIHKRIIGRIFVSNLYDYDKTIVDLEKLKAEKLKAKEKVRLIEPNKSIGGTKLESVRCYKGLTKNYNVFCPELVKANRPDGKSVRGASSFFYRKVEVDSNGVVVQSPKGTTRVIEEMMNASKAIIKNKKDGEVIDAKKTLTDLNQSRGVKPYPTTNFGLLQKGIGENMGHNGSVKVEENQGSLANTSQVKEESPENPNGKVPGEDQTTPVKSSAVIIQDTKKFFKSRIDADVKKKIYRGKELGYAEQRIEDIQRERVRDTERSDRMSKDEKDEMVHFFNTANQSELWLLPGCSKKSSEYIMANRPYKSLEDLHDRVGQTKTNTATFLNGYKEIMSMRKNVNELIDKCQQIADKMQEKVGTLLACSINPPNEEELKKLENSIEVNKDEENNKPIFLKGQPSILNKDFTLTPYQLVGLNWLKILHHENLNGILADEMGLGKTIQAISFLAHLKEISDPGPHLVICPTSTLDNWKREFGLWCPSLRLCVYSGSIEERKERRKALRNKNEFDVLLTSYSIGTSTIEDRTMMKQLEFHYGIFDEAHMLKNIASARFKALMNFQIKRKILLTGTPIQNNLVELMSLLHFVMPNMTFNSVDLLKKMFLVYGQSNQANEEVRFETECLMKAKNLLKPFCLRRLKNDVLSQLPKKLDKTVFIEMSPEQAAHYKDLLKAFKKSKIAANEAKESDTSPAKKKSKTPAARDAKTASSASTSAISQLMELRKVANHSMLGSRLHYTQADLMKMAKKLKKDKSHADAEEEYILQDLENLNDYQVHKICLMYDCIKDMSISSEKFQAVSGKLNWFRENLPRLFSEGHRILIFSQFVIVLAILQDFMEEMKIKYVRLDGSTDYRDRQTYIDEFNNDPEIKVFLLSTRAGGQGINLTGADTVILHDIDFNPYNDKQAEDRCHRLGQKKEVSIIRMIAKGTIEESILRIANEKLKLEQNVTNTGKLDNGENGKKRKIDEEAEDEDEIEEFTELKVLGSPNKNCTSPVNRACKPKAKIDENFAKSLLDELTIDE